jgi:phage major head subunit gpT-like protein
MPNKVIITPQLMSALFQAFNTAFQTGILMPGITYWPGLATPVPSSTDTEVYGWLAQQTGFSEWIGPRNVQSLRLEGYSIQNRQFENTIGVKQTQIEDDRFGVLTPVFQQLGLDAKEHPDTILMPMLANGVNLKCYDGKPFFAPNHPVRLDPDKNKATDFSNLDSGGAGGNPYWFLFDTTKVLKPLILQQRKDYTFVRKDAPTDEHMFRNGEALYGSDARLNGGFGMWQLAQASNQDLTAANFNAARARMMGIKRDNGRPANAKPNVIHVGTSQLATAEALFNTAMNAAGATNPLYKVVEVVWNPYLD